MAIEITLLGTGSPIPDPHRAGPATLVRTGGQTLLVDCGRGVLQRAAAVDVGANNLDALLLTHLHSDHITDLGDVIITRWVTTFDAQAAPLPIIGPPGTAEVVRATLEAFGFDIGYRIALDDLSAGADALVHTVIREDLVNQIPMQRFKDICDYHSSVQQAAATAARAGVGTLILTHYVPAIAPGQEEQWRQLAATEFDGRIELGDDLHRVQVG